jgi:hypothetical protein
MLVLMLLPIGKIKRVILGNYGLAELMLLHECMGYRTLNLFLDLKNADIKVDRKILADIAVNDPKGFKKLVDIAKDNLNG